MSQLAVPNAAVAPSRESGTADEVQKSVVPHGEVIPEVHLDTMD